MNVKFNVDILPSLNLFARKPLLPLLYFGTKFARSDPLRIKSFNIGLQNPLWDSHYRAERSSCGNFWGLICYLLKVLHTWCFQCQGYYYGDEYVKIIQNIICAWEENEFVESMTRMYSSITGVKRHISVLFFVYRM